MPAGRPRLIKSPEEMQKMGEAYFAQCKADKSPVTVTGLALALGLSSRESLIEYGKRDEYSDTVKRLKTVVEHHYEIRLCGNNPTGAIFALKNFGWTDKIEQALTGRMTLEQLVCASYSKDEPSES